VSVFTGVGARSHLSDSQRFDNYEYDGIHVERFHHDLIPMGGQSNVVEAEYNNWLFASYFRKYLNILKPDLVHFFHLRRLSASAIDVCYDLGIPTVFTLTDFWLICPTYQLLLPDNSLCLGPEVSGVNCLRHVVTITQPTWVSSILAKFPDWLVTSLILAMNKGVFLKSRIPLYIRALHNRPEFMRQRFNKLDKVIVPTRLMQDFLQKNGFSSDNIVFSSYGIDLGHGYQEKTDDGRGKLRVGFIGTLREPKGVHVLVQAIRLLSDDEPVELNIYGEINKNPEYFHELKTIAGGDTRIVFRGTFPNSRIGLIFSSIDVLVVPSIWYENTPLVIYSAQAAGCPVVASNLGGMAEVVRHNENGLLFKPGNVSELAEIIKQLARDKQLLRKLSTKTKPKSISEYVSELLNIYKEILETKQKAI
jgi:glycosyltransferase involved in cell wall biosynthesis